MGHASAADLAALRVLLRECSLPDDLGSHPDTVVLVAAGPAGVVGGVAVEGYGGDGLLRSLVVVRHARGAGVGGALVRRAVAEAVARGMRRLYLLTETAGGYFAARGFRPVDRAGVPEAVRASSEFATLCPDTAAAMVLEG